MAKSVYTKSTATRAEVFEVIQHATNNLVDAASELSRYPYTATSSELIDGVLGIAEKVQELRHLHDGEEALPGNVVRFRGRA